MRESNAAAQVYRWENPLLHSSPRETPDVGTAERELAVHRPKTPTRLCMHMSVCAWMAGQLRDRVVETGDAMTVSRKERQVVRRESESHGRGQHNRGPSEGPQRRPAGQHAEHRTVPSLPPLLQASPETLVLCLSDISVNRLLRISNVSTPHVEAPRLALLEGQPVRAKAWYPGCKATYVPSRSLLPPSRVANDHSGLPVQHCNYLVLHRLTMLLLLLNIHLIGCSASSCR